MSYAQQQPPRARASFSWNIHSDKVLMDYCSYFINPDGSVDDSIWAPLANELKTSAASCRMRWHVLKCTANQETWKQHQTYMRQQLHHTVNQQNNQTFVEGSTWEILQDGSGGNPEYCDAEFDAYLQRILWEDEDFVRAVDAIHNQREESNFNLFESPEHE